MRFSTKEIHVDIETGEILVKWDAIENYNLIKKTKHVTIDKNCFRATVTITKIYRRKNARQLNIW